MSRVILIYGQSGAGKTTSCRNLDPKSTLYIDCDGKGLSWQGWRKAFNAANKNYVRTTKIKPSDVKDRAQNSVQELLSQAEGQSHIKVIVVDGINTLMLIDEFRRMRSPNFQGWVELATSVYGLFRQALSMRDDLTVVFIGHAQILRADDGTELETRLKTSGRKLEKIVLEGECHAVLRANAIGSEHFFEVHANNSTAKTPLGAYPPEQLTVPNDLAAVLSRLDQFEKGE